MEVVKEGKLICPDSANDIVGRFSGKPRSRANWRGLEDATEETVTISQIRKTSGVDPSTLNEIVRVYEDKTGFTIQADRGRYHRDDVELIYDWVSDWKNKRKNPGKPVKRQIVEGEAAMQSFTSYLLLHRRSPRLKSRHY